MANVEKQIADPIEQGKYYTTHHNISSLIEQIFEQLVSTILINSSEIVPT